MALASAVAALGVSGVAAGSASAADGTFDHGYLKISLPNALQIIDGTTGPVRFNNFNPDGTTGDFTEPNADVVFPAFDGELSGIPLHVDVDLNSSEITGNYNVATGAMTVNQSSWKATITVAGSECVIDPIQLSFSSASNSVFQGDAFDAASNPPTNGAISATWPDLPDGTPANNCALINSAGAGPGGLWLSNGTPSAPTLTPPPPSGGGGGATTPAPKKKKCKKKKKGKSASAAKSKCKKKKK